MPRRQTREIQRWRRGRGRQQQVPQQIVQIRGRKAIELMRQMEIQQAAKTGREPNPAAATNDMLARTGAWRRRRQFPPVAWGAGLAVIGEILHTTRNPVLFGIVGGIGAAALLILCTRHLSGFGRRWFDAAAFLSLGWLPALAVFGWGAPVPALLAVTVVGASGAWWRHYRFRPHEPQPEPVPDTTSDQAVWERLAAKRRWSAKLTSPENIPGGGVKWQIETDGIETHIGNIMSEPRAIAAAFGKAQTEAYVEPHPTGIESKGTFTRLKSETLQVTEEWGGSGFDSRGIARIGRYADGQSCRIRAWVPMDGTRHGLIAGTSGAGKSELLNLMLWLAVNSEVPIVPLILDPQNGQSLPQWRGRVLYAAGVESCARMMRGINAGMMDRSRRLASMTWDDDGHKAYGMQFFDARLSGLPVIMPIIDEAPLLLSGDGNAKLGAEMVRLTAQGAKLDRKAGGSKWAVAQVPSLAELGDQTLRSMLVGGNVIGLRTGDRVSGGMIGLETDPYTLPKYFPDGEPTQGLGYAVTLDNRQAPMRTDLVPSRLRHKAVEVPQLEDEFLEAMHREMSKGLPLANVAPLTAAAQPDQAADDGPDGRRCIDAVWTVLQRAGREMERGEIISEVGKLTAGEWERDKPFSIRSVTNALADLAGGKDPSRPVVKPRDGVYEALAPRDRPEDPPATTAA